MFKKRTEVDYVFTKLEYEGVLKLHEQSLLDFLLIKLQVVLGRLSFQR